MPAGTEISVRTAGIKTSDHDGFVSVTGKPGAGLIELDRRHGEPAAVFRRPSLEPVCSDPLPQIVPQDGTGEQTHRSGENGEDQAHLILSGVEPFKRHDQFRRDRWENVFGENQQGNAEITAALDEGGDPIEHMVVCPVTGSAYASGGVVSGRRAASRTSPAASRFITKIPAPTIRSGQIDG